MKSNSALEKATFKTALQSQKRAHAPYSRFRVGAGLRSGKKIFGGCNVENSSYGATICAERSAILNAVSAGCKKFDHLIVITPNGAGPCALCLQVLSEFVGSDFPISIATPRGIVAEVKFGQLLRLPFRRSDLKRRSRISSRS